ncbi:MAG TPA: methyltransferase domain-containing protein [Blastocatellia bacterium]|nr:methyltransferase domain-containing protein [Blastocatellia bacterium]
MPEMRSDTELVNTLNDAISDGHYAKKQLLCKDWLIAWSHRSRFQMGLSLAREFSGKRVLDYGCGDGTFLAMLMSDASAPGSAVGVEAHSSLIDDCRARFGKHSGLSFIPDDELDDSRHAAAYDAVFCMEVLEHVVELNPMLDRLNYLLSPAGKLFVSVPVETGLPLIVKQTARRIAAWRGLGDYKYTSAYKLSEYWKSLFPRDRQHITRPVYKGEGDYTYHDHKGFNWMRLRKLLAERYEIERTVSSPLSWLPPHLASQVWFVARKKS